MSALLDELRETAVINIDYVGFTYNGIHSSQLNILSVSDGSRYTSNLLPTIEDYSVDIVGGYGSNYFGGTFKRREFTLNIAYDNVNEEHFMAMREWLSDREVHELYFDENPYLVYQAVVSRAPTFKYIAFGDVGTRVYKGEGTIIFTCYNPLAYSYNGNYLEDYEDKNIEEWSVASGMLENKHKYSNGNKIVDYYDTPRVENNKTVIHAYNAGILPTPFKLYLIWDSKELTISQKVNNEEKNKLVFKRTATTPIKILIDTERAVALTVESAIGSEITINGVTTYCYTVSNRKGEKTTVRPKETNEVLNQLVETGRFFKLPQGYSDLEITGATIAGGSEKVTSGANELTYTADNFQFYHRYL